MDWGPDLGMVILVLVVYGALTAALGMLLGSLARTEGQAVGIGVISSNVLAALGGCWWPIEIAPSWMQSVQLVLPTGWAWMRCTSSSASRPDRGASSRT